MATKLKITKLEAFQAELIVPGDKSISHRAAILGAIANGTTKIHNFSTAQDCRQTLKCLSQLGIAIEQEDYLLKIHGNGLFGLQEPEDILECGNSGTTMRLLSGLLAGQPFFSVLSGDDSLRNRPMKRIIEPIRMMGRHLYGRKNNSLPPLCFPPAQSRLKRIRYEMPVASAQVKSALLLAGLYTNGRHVIIEPVPTRDHTERMLPLFGRSLQRKDNQLILNSGRSGSLSQELFAAEITIPGDISSAAFFLCLACLIPDSQITVKQVGLNPTRTALFRILKDMGVDILVHNSNLVSDEPRGDVTVGTSILNSTQIDGEIIPQIIDELPIIAVLATQAHGQTIVHDAAELRVKESDRIRAIVTELKKMGAHISELDDGFIINGPTPFRGTECQTYNDHRIAMALTIAGLLATGETTLDDIGCVNISFPEFFQSIQNLSGKNPFEFCYK